MYDKRILRLTVVDHLIGMEQEVWTNSFIIPSKDGSIKNEKATFHRDDEICAPLIIESYIEEIDSNLKNAPHGCWFSLDIDSMVRFAADDIIGLQRQFGNSISFDAEDYELMKDDFIYRLKNRLTKYGKSKRIEEKAFPDGRYGFRYG